MSPCCRWTTSHRRSHQIPVISWWRGAESASQTFWLFPVSGRRQCAGGGRGRRECAQLSEPSALRRGLQGRSPAGAARGGSATRGPEHRARPVRTWTILHCERPEEPSNEVRRCFTFQAWKASQVRVPGDGRRGPGSVLLTVSSAFRYSHDGSETLEDLIEFTATDGSNSVPFVLEVKVTSLFLVLTAEPWWS